MSSSSSSSSSSSLSAPNAPSTALAERQTAEHKLTATKQESIIAEQKLAAAEQKLAAAEQKKDPAMVQLAKQGMITAQNGVDSCQKLVTLYTDQIVKLETASFAAPVLSGLLHTTHNLTSL